MEQQAVGGAAENLSEKPRQKKGTLVPQKSQKSQ
jgi:hypothetical protein